MSGRISRPTVARTILAAAVLALPLAGCAQIAWTKAGATDAEFIRDRYECERDVRQSQVYRPGTLLAELDAIEFKQECMRARGYYPVRVDSNTRVIR